MKKTVIPFDIIITPDIFKSTICLLEGKINKKKAFFLLDTGASKTILSEEISRKLPKNKIKSIPFGIAGINNNNSNQVGFADVQLGFGKISKQQQCPVQDISSFNQIFSFMGVKEKLSGVLGADFMNEFSAVIDFPNKTLTLKY